MRRVVLGTCALGAMVAVGCTEGEDVLLGRAQRLPEAPPDEADAGDAGEPSEPPEFDPLEERRCEVASEGRLETLVHIQGIAEPSCTGSCSIQPDSVRVAADGSAWVSASMNSRERLWLGHFGAAGELLGSVVVDNRSIPGHLELDDHGNAWLLTGQLADGSSRLYRFNAAVQEIGKQSLSGYYTDMASYPGTGMLLSAGTQLRTVTALDYEGAELWSRTDSGRGYACLAADAEGNIAVGSGRSGGGGEGDVVLDWLDDPQGELGGTAYPLLQHEGYGPFAFMDMTFDAEGHLTLASAQPSMGSGPHRSQTNVERVDRVQGTLWRWQISSQPGPANAVDLKTGSTLVMATRTDAAKAGQPIDAGLALVAISPDGSLCRRFTVDGPDLFGDIDVGPNGEIWFAGIKARPGSIVADIGRWERPDL